VDWSGTRAYALGLSGIYLNRTGREARGTVDPDQAAHLKQEIIQRLRELRDEQEDSRPIREVYDARKCFEGPYVDESPDLIVGFSPGYRISWSGATGTVTDAVFEDNVRRWSGDHCLNPSDVPGVFFCNRKVDIDGIRITDIAPTVMNLFGVPIPSYCDGRPMSVHSAEVSDSPGHE
jgi:predicted AlkP superfamily phosphohydrolase/phosphomutase